MTETFYIKRLDASNDLCQNTHNKWIVPAEEDPSSRWLWLAVWTNTDREERFNRYEWNDRYAGWELVADDYPQCSEALDNAVNKQLTDEVLTQLYERELTEFEISITI